MGGFGFGHHRGLFALLTAATLASLVSGLVDGLVSIAATGRPFALSWLLVQGGHYPTLFVYILVHNIGLGAAVVTFGLVFLAFRLEWQRLLGLRVLLAAIMLALLLGALAVSWRGPFFWALAAMEAVGVLLLAVPSYQLLRTSEPLDSRAIAPWAFGSFAVLAFASLVETVALALRFAAPR